MATYKFPIFEALTAMDKKDYTWFNKQTEEAKKAFAAPVFLRWASAIEQDGLAGAYTLIAINKNLNIGFWDILNQDPELVYILAASCGTKLNKKHCWIKSNSLNNSNNKFYEILSKIYPTANDVELKILVSQFNNKKEVKEFLEDAGILQENISSILKDYDKISIERNN